MPVVAGHTASWGKGYPELLTQCCDKQGVPNGQLGPLNPTRNSTYNALWLLLREAAQLFPDTYLHLGGDEVPFDCWQVCSETHCLFIQCALNIFVCMQNTPLGLEAPVMTPNGVFFLSLHARQYVKQHAKQLLCGCKPCMHDVNMWMHKMEQVLYEYIHQSLLYVPTLILTSTLE